MTQPTLLTLSTVLSLLKLIITLTAPLLLVIRIILASFWVSRPLCAALLTLHMCTWQVQGPYLSYYTSPEKTQLRGRLNLRKVRMAPVVCICHSSHSSRLGGSPSPKQYYLHFPVALAPWLHYPLSLHQVQVIRLVTETPQHKESGSFYIIYMQG
jgi:hypothetical protein